jgi:hypothetical protein
MTNQEIAEAISHKLFADRETIKEAWDYAMRVINSLHESDRIAATTALMVMLNTVAKELTKEESK